MEYAEESGDLIDTEKWWLSIVDCVSVLTGC